MLWHKSQTLQSTLGVDRNDHRKTNVDHCGSLI